MDLNIKNKCKRIFNRIYLPIDMVLVNKVTLIMIHPLSSRQGMYHIIAVTLFLFRIQQVRLIVIRFSN